MGSHILLVDDDDMTAEAIESILVPAGYVVHRAVDGPAALVEAQKNPPHVVLLDLILPGMTGIAVCAEMRRRPETRRVPIVVLTARDDEDHVTRAFAAGADDYITKPVRRYELLPRLGAHLRSKRLLEELEEQVRDRNLLLDLSNTLASRFDLRQILHIVASRLLEAIRVERCAIVLFDPASDRGLVAAASDDAAVQDLPISLKNYPEIMEVIQTRAPLVIPDTESHPLFAPLREQLAQTSVRASILFPMLATNDMIGVLLLRSSQPIEALSTREVTFGKTVATATAIAVRNARMFEGIAEESVQLDVERREAGEKLATVRRFEAFIEGAADGVLIFDTEARVTSINKRAGEILGIAPGHDPHVDFFTYVHPDERERVHSVIADPMANSHLGVFDVRVAVGGQSRTLSASVSGFLQEHGAALFTFRDVTQERATEAELVQTKEFLENLINSSVDPIIAWSPLDGMIVLFSHSAEALFGHAAADVVGHKRMTDIFADTGAEEVMRELRRPERGGHGRLELSRRDVVAKDGNRIPVNFTAALVFEGKKEVAVVGIFSDLRERLRIENKLSVAQQKLHLSERQVVIAELAGTTAHELNQPLTSVMGYAELLARKVPEGPLKRPIEVILKEAERMAEIVRKIGRITKYETKTYVGATRIVDLDKAVEDDGIVIPPPKGPARSS